MKKIYFIALLMLTLSCTKNDEVQPDENIVYLESVNNLRLNNNPPINVLTWSDEYLTLCEKSIIYYDKNGAFPDINIMINEMGIKGKVCIIGVDTSNVPNFDVIKYLSTTAGSFTYNPQYIKFAIKVKNNVTAICFGY